MDPHPQTQHERETRSLRRVGRGLVAGGIVGGLIGGAIGLAAGIAVYGWWTGGMAGAVLTGAIGGGGLGWFVGGLSRLDDRPRGDEPLPDPTLTTEVRDPTDAAGVDTPASPWDAARRGPERR
jgi:hypothetical protein